MARRGGGGGAVAETRRFGKRGKLVKHGAAAAAADPGPALTLVAPGGGADCAEASAATTVQRDGVLCTKL